MGQSKLEHLLFGRHSGQQFGYDAVESTPRRKVPFSDLRSEDDLLPGYLRNVLSHSARDSVRNWAIAAFIIRKHLDFVSKFRFKANTENKAFNKQFEDYIERWSRRKNCHVAKRHRLSKLIRMAEACRTLDGDVFIEKIKGGTINLIRGDRIQNPHGRSNGDGWTNGIYSDARTGVSLKYAVHRRKQSRLVFEKNLLATNAIHHGYFNDPEHIRGIAPFSTAVNPLRDTYEGNEFALARMKAEMLLGFAVETDPSPEGNPWQGNRQFGDGLPEDMTDEERLEAYLKLAEDEAKSSEIDFGKGIFFARLKRGESMKSISGNMPSSNAQRMLDTSVMIAMKALDLPFSFFRENFTNFYGSRGALQLYKESAEVKQSDNAEVLDEVTEWIAVYGVITGELRLPRGWTIADLSRLWQWVPKGIPWWDRSKEVIGDLRAISAGLDSPQNVALRHGSNTYEENVDATAAAVGYWNSKPELLGVSPAYLGPIATDSVQPRRRKKDSKE